MSFYLCLWSGGIGMLYVAVKDCFYGNFMLYARKAWQQMILFAEWKLFTGKKTCLLMRLAASI